MTHRVIHGHALEILRTLPDASAHMCLTSPPYWSLRDYDVPPSVWGGRRECLHVWDEHQHCACGAWFGNLGLEPTPDLYVQHLVLVFDEVWRVLRDDGTLWLNLGDCYAAAPTGSVGFKSGLQGSLDNQHETQKASGHRRGCRGSFSRDRIARGDIAHKAAPGVKPKDLIGIPWMVAFALRDRGWYLRQEVIWNKRNPRPEAVRDRPARAHEQVFLLAKSAEYFYDHEAVREANADGGSHNCRSVWTLSTAPYKGKHFATMPPKVVEPCIKAGTSEHGCCSWCGVPYERIVKRGAALVAQKRRSGADRAGAYRGTAVKDYTGTGAENGSDLKRRILAGMRERITTGWVAPCGHALSTPEACVVLDPFSGAGTTGLVASRLGRSFIGIELNADYIALSHERMAATHRTTAPVALMEGDCA